MSLSHLEVLVLYLLTGSVMATLLVVIGLWAWAIRRLLQGDPLLSQKPILPMQPARWGGRTVLAVILLYIGVNLVVGLGFGVAAGLRRPAPPTQVAAPHSEERPAPEIEAARGLAVESEVGPTDEGEDEHSEHRSPFNAMLLNSLASLLFVVTLPVVLQGSAGVAVEELGFSWKEWPLQVGVGAIAALLTVPVVYAVQSLAVQIWDVREHPVQQMMADGMSPGVGALAVVSTVFLAPMVEESLFRGVILGWLTRIFTQVSTSSLNVRESEGGGEPASGTFPATRQNESSPDAQPTDSAPVKLTATQRDAVPSHRNEVCLPAVVVASMLFAGMHAPQWPAPVGIFLLALVLGVVYQRTGSLLTAMVMHGVFNGCSTLLLLQGLLARSVQDLKPTAPEISPRLVPAVRWLIEWCSCYF